MQAREWGKWRPESLGYMKNKKREEAYRVVIMEREIITNGR
jgi:hypothetical protein